MPLYDYRCAKDHWTERYSSVEGRLTPPTCGCGLPTIIGIKGRTGEWKEEERAARRQTTAATRRIRDLHCQACGHIEDAEIIEAPFPDSAPCPACGSVATYELPQELVTYRDSLLAKEITGGWYDRGAGRHFASKKQRKEWMKREGVECTEGADLSREMGEADTRGAALEAQYVADCDRYANHPRTRKAWAEMQNNPD